MTDLFDAHDPVEWLTERLSASGTLQREFALQVGLSEEHLSNLLSGRRGFTPEVQKAVIAALRLDSREEEQQLAYLFRAAFEESKDDRVAAWVEVLAGRLRRRAAELPAAARAAALDLDGLALRELCLATDLRPDSAALGAALLPPRPTAEAKALLEGLGSAGLLARDGSPLRAAPAPAVMAREPLDAARLRPLLSQARDRALWALDAIPKQERHFGVLFQRVPEGVLPELREELDRLRLRVAARCEEARRKGAPSTRVYALLSQTLPLTARLRHSSGAEPRAPQPDGPAPPWEPGDPPPTLFEHADYRLGLADWKAWRRKSFQWLSGRVARILPEGERLSAQQIYKILSQKAHVSPSHVSAWASVLGLDRSGRRYLAATVAAHRETDPAERERRARVAEGFRLLGQGERLGALTFDFFSSWLAPTLTELAWISSFEARLGWLQEALLPQVSEAELSESLALLQQLRFLTRTRDRRLVPARDLTLQTLDEDLTRDAMRALFTDIGRLGGWAFDHLPVEDRDLHLTLGAVPEDLQPVIGEDLEATRTRVQGLADAALKADQGGERHRVWLMSLQWFPVCQAPGDRKS